MNEIWDLLKDRFDANMYRHPNIHWENVAEILEKKTEKLESLKFMEETGGEPDVLELSDGSFVYCDCSKETPIGRRSLCYDEEALLTRKKNPPAGSACSEAEKMGVRLMKEDEYRYLQEIQEVDLKTSSWIHTPEDIRSKGGALFMEKRYGNVFVFHNGAGSYYSVRGFRTILDLS